ncbi:NADP-dependent oxidoreductase domain-containing protein [Aspergillus spectabilis]
MVGEESQVQYCRLGNSGLRVSVPIFGCMGLVNVYNNGVSEVSIGKALKKYSIPREDMVIMTKCFWASQKTQIHRFDNTTPIEGTMQTLNDLILSEKVRYIGASSIWTKFINMQNQYNLLYRQEEPETIPRKPEVFGSTARSVIEKEAGKKAMVWAATDGLDETDLETIRRVVEIAERKRWPMAHVSLG